MDVPAWLRSEFARRVCEALYPNGNEDTPEHWRANAADEKRKKQHVSELLSAAIAERDQARSDAARAAGELIEAVGRSNAVTIELAAAREENGRLREALADDIRAAGWVVAVHNDYTLNGEPFTFWLFTKDGRAVRGEGRTDADALAVVRRETGLIDFLVDEERGALAREGGDDA